MNAKRLLLTSIMTVTLILNPMVTRADCDAALAQCRETVAAADAVIQSQDAQIQLQQDFNSKLTERLTEMSTIAEDERNRANAAEQAKARNLMVGGLIGFAAFTILASIVQPMK